MHTPSWIPLTDMVNVRDVGGMPTDDGRTTRHGVILRGETPDELHPLDVAHLVDTLGLGLVVDLRMPTEREGRRYPLHEAGPDIWLLPMWDDPLITADIPRDVAEADGPASVANFYMRVIDAFQHRAAPIMTRLVDEPGATLIHCTGGKDRTGMIVALLLGAAGVEHEAIVADYAATHTRLTPLYQRLTRVIGVEHPPKGIPEHMMGAHPDTMRIVIDTLVDQHGSIAQWWRVGGVDDATREAWKARLIA
jgi:protein-tyrosine phosphatase